MLGILQVGEDMTSSRYVRNKIKDCEEIGIIACERVLHGDVTTIGKPKFLSCYPIYVPVIDVGINFIEGEDGKMYMVGYYCNTENRDVTLVQGGVGLLTRYALLENV